MQRNTLVVGVAVALAVVVVGYLVADAYFLPEASTRVDEPLPDAMMDDHGMDEMAEGMPHAVARGTFSGADALHSVSGAVALYEGEDGWFLRFEDYEATDGPDVYFYLVKGDGAVEEGYRVLVPGGEEGRATLRGNFNVPLEGDAMDWSAYDGVVVWCDRFDVRFGSATLVAT